MIEYNVTPVRIPDGHTATESVRERTSKWWSHSEQKLEDHGDIALSVERNTVTEVSRINGWHRDPTASGKFILDLAELPDDHPARAWIGRTAPIPWEPGQRQPFKYVSRRGLVPTPPAEGSPS